MVGRRRSRLIQHPLTLDLFLLSVSYRTRGDIERFSGKGSQKNKQGE
jgi:hypothetical protein